MKKKTGWLLVLVIAALFRATCQANYIRDVQEGTVAPSSSSELTGLAVQ
ncbi:colicin release lysis protein [Salmonella enterica]|nr:colicin release lysis protein [Salmonella enterica]